MSENKQDPPKKDLESELEGLIEQNESQSEGMKKIIRSIRPSDKNNSK